MIRMPKLPASKFAPRGQKPKKKKDPMRHQFEMRLQAKFAQERIAREEAEENARLAAEKQMSPQDAALAIAALHVRYPQHTELQGLAVGLCKKEIPE
jgi:hypothetical protein